MKKKRLLIIFSVLFLIVACFGIFYNIESKSYNDENSSSSTIQIKEEDTLSMMLETAYESGEYKQVTQSSWPEKGYTFNATLSKCENGSELSWDDEQKLVYFTGNSIDKCYIYFDKLKDPTLAEYVIKQYGGTQGNNNIYYHTSSLSNSAGDNSYRYAGASASVNNYVCLGSDESTCPDNNLFRIIGVFGAENDDVSNATVKLIRAKSIGGMTWDSAGSITWATASLNTYLNGTYLTNLKEAIGNTIYNKIVDTTWKVCGFGYVYSDTPKKIYVKEITDCTTGYGPAKIGLMYASDYLYGASSGAWTRRVYETYKAVTAINWLYLYNAWFISPRTGGTTVWLIGGNIMSTSSNASYPPSYPTFYLNSSVTYVSGSGSASDPIRVS